MIFTTIRYSTLRTLSFYKTDYSYHHKGYKQTSSTFVTYDCSTMT